MKLYKDGKEFCSAIEVSRFYLNPDPSRPRLKELRVVLEVDAIVTPLGMNESPRPIYEFEDDRGKRRVYILTSSAPDTPAVIVSF